eukprot:3395234-Heterocapsa_arctica.AAC.1
MRAFLGMFFQDGLRVRRDFGFKLRTSSVPAQKTKKLSSELANGRLAMAAFIGMFFQDGLLARRVFG